MALLLCSPLLGIAWLCGARLNSLVSVGRDGRQILEKVLVNRYGREVPVLGSLARLWNVAMGELAWIGPATRSAQELQLHREDDRRVHSIRPGLICTWWIRSRTNVAYGTQTEADLEYLDSRCLRTDAGILMRAAATLLYGASGNSFSPEARILGLPVDNLTLDQAVDAIVAPSQAPLQVSFLNVDCVNKAMRDGHYRTAICESGLRLADGIGLRIAGRLLKSEIRQNVNGTDLFPQLCARMQDNALSVYLLGARPGVAEDVAKWVRRQYPGLRVAGVRHGYWAPEDEDAVVDTVRRSGADILLVALGAPAQETFLRRHLDELGVRAALGVGGLFDFYSGRVTRAPQWLRDIGMEWTYRLYQEPGRMWRRYLVGNGVFLARVAYERMRRQRRG